MIAGDAQGNCWDNGLEPLHFESIIQRFMASEICQTQESVSVQMVF